MEKKKLPLYVRHSGSVMVWECTAASVTESLQDHLWSEADQSASKCKRMMTPPQKKKIPKVTQKCIKERKKLDIFPPVKSVTRSQNMCFSDGR